MSQRRGQFTIKTHQLSQESYDKLEYMANHKKLSKYVDRLVQEEHSAPVGAVSLDQSQFKQLLDQLTDLKAEVVSLREEVRSAEIKQVETKEQPIENKRKSFELKSEQIASKDAFVDLDDDDLEDADL